MQGIRVNLYMNKSLNNPLPQRGILSVQKQPAIFCTKITRMAGFGFSVSGSVVLIMRYVLECVSEADETVCTGWEVMAHSRFWTFSCLLALYRWDFPIIWNLLPVRQKREFSMIIFASDLKMFTYFKGTVSVLPGADAGYGGINLTE